MRSLPPADDPSAPRPTGPRRAAVALALGAASLLVVLFTTGLLRSAPIGAGDNGDGYRLYCGAGLVPHTPDGQANWKGGVVLAFDRGSTCPDGIPSSALPMLRAASQGANDGWSLTRLGWLYALAVAAAATAAAWAATAAGLRRALILVPAILPLLSADLSRFFISTYSEPAGLLGAFALVGGIGAIVVTSPTHRVERLVALALVGSGGLVAATAKPGYLPLLAVAVVVCGATAVSRRRPAPRWQAHVLGPVAALAVLVIAVAPLSAELRWQREHWETVNAHNLIYTTVLTEVPDSAPSLGLPDTASSAAGQAYFPKGPEGVPGADVVAAEPGASRQAAVRILATHPAALLRAVGIGMQATQGAAITYLPTQAWTPETPVPHDTPPGEAGADRATLHAWLDAMPIPWWPSAVVVLGLVAGLVGLWRRAEPWSAFARLAGAGALAAIGLAAAAVLGDGYFEIAKHVWLTAYLVDVTALSLVGTAITGAAATLRPTTRRSALHRADDASARPDEPQTTAVTTPAAPASATPV